MAKKQDKKFEPQSKYNRNFSEAFRRSKVKEIVSGRLKVGELCRLYELSRSTVYKWVYLYSEAEKGVKTVVQMESEALKTKMLLDRVAELERIIGQKQLEIDYLNKAFDLAGEELGYDIKKKYAPKRSNGFEGTKNNTGTP